MRIDRCISHVGHLARSNFVLILGVIRAVSWDLRIRVVTKVCRCPDARLSRFVFDYPDFDPSSGRLYIAHMNARSACCLRHVEEAGFSLISTASDVCTGRNRRARNPSTLCLCDRRSPGLRRVDTENTQDCGKLPDLSLTPDGLAYAPKAEQGSSSPMSMAGSMAVIDAGKQ